jgi:hypothetical protein
VLLVRTKVTATASTKTTAMAMAMAMAKIVDRSVEWNWGGNWKLETVERNEAKDRNGLSGSKPHQSRREEGTEDEAGATVRLVS